MNVLKLTVLIALIAVTFGCKKNNNNDNAASPVSGKYSGQLIANENATNQGTIVDNITVSFTGNKYNTVSTSPGFGIDAQGVFKMVNHQLALQDSLVHTANFDWGLILSGSYSYVIKADSLILIKASGENSYTYKLKRQ